LREPIEEMMRQPFFQTPPPRSTDGPAMIEQFETVRATRNASFLERVSTATLLTAASIQLAIMRFLPGKPQEIIVSGGGTRNWVLMEHLRRWEWFGGDVKTTDELGIPSEAKEAVAFALLGAATMDGEPSNVPSVTGAKRAVVLGSITPKPSPQS
jgi:anhydro-N-acetylmuramic acid kinase